MMALPIAVIGDGGVMMMGLSTMNTKARTASSMSAAVPQRRKCRVSPSAIASTSFYLMSSTITHAAPANQNESSAARRRRITRIMPVK